MLLVLQGCGISRFMFFNLKAEKIVDSGYAVRRAGFDLDAASVAQRLG